ncbi:hypothetical protein BDN71DRAFT_1589662 [Pleurotus eryngii]|uniref:Uncharacterized protein n=1 Tax=Pleurotus eryngii TaxID=5323 RepID=A0A9P5ZWE7_PLEER|nr:hypothetical protein BDN71DRAFT_1589662 [Pleurotus eryngii]
MQSIKRKATASPRSRREDDESYASSHDLPGNTTPRKPCRQGSSLSPSAKSRARSTNNHAIFEQRYRSLQDPEQEDQVAVNGDTQVNLPLQLYKNQHVFNHRFIATEGRRPCYAIRTYNGSYTSINPLAFIQHVYPFSQLRQFKVHILPHFVIFNMGMKLDKILGGSTILDNIYSKLDISEPNTAAHITSCLDLYRLWMSRSPSDTFTNFHQLVGFFPSTQPDVKP